MEIEKTLDELNKKFDIGKIPLIVPIDTLGKIEYEVAWVLLLKIWKKKKRITPVSAKEMGQMLKEDQGKYQEFLKRFREKLYQKAEEKLKKINSIKRSFIKRKKRKKLLIKLEGAMIEKWIIEALSKEEIEKIAQETKREINLSWNPLFEPPFDILGPRVLMAFRKMEEEGLIKIINSPNEGEVIIPEAKMFKPIFEKYAQ